MKRDLISHIPLSLLGGISCLCLFVMTFSVPTGFHLWAFAGLTAVLAPCLGETAPRRRAIALAILAAVYLGTVLTHFSAARNGIADLIRAVNARYSAVYTGSAPRVIWTGDADYALLLPFGGVTLALGLWIGGKNRRWLPPVALTALIFSLCVAVNSFDTRQERLAVLALTVFWLIMTLAGGLRRYRQRGAIAALALLPLILLLTAGVYLAWDPDSWVRTESQNRVVSAFQKDWSRLLRSLGFDVPEAEIEGPDQMGNEGDPTPGGHGTESAPVGWSDQNRQGFDLHEVGPRIDRGITVFRLKADRSDPLYLRGYSLGDYDPETGWLAPEPYTFPAASDLSSVLIPDPRYLPYRILQQHDHPNVRAEIRRVSADTATSLMPYFHSNQIMQMWDDENGSAYYLEGNDVRTYDMLTHYTVLYVPYSGDYSELLDTQGYPDGYTEHVRNKYLTLPEGYREALLPILQEASVPAADRLLKNGDRLSAAKRIAAYLDRLARYDKMTPYTRTGEDFALYFLTQSHRGYCIHFATAGALLCRAAGIPARYVSGFLAQAPETGEWTNVTDESAHAWVEIFLEGFGWVPVEMTPAGRDTSAVVDETTRPAGSTGPTAQTTTLPEGQTAPFATDPGEGEIGTGSHLDLTWLPWAACAAFLPALILLQREWRLARRRRRFKEKDLNRSTLYVWRLALRTARYGGEIPEELRDLAEKARFSREGVDPEERERAITLFCDLRDGTYASLPRRKRIAMRLWSALK